jgi:sugar O-acyltransferase (sialic acid O-acetyltransferase NeuD family)
LRNVERKNSKKPIIIVCARCDGHAGVVLDIIREYALYEVVGFLDDDVTFHHKKVLGIPVLGSVDSYFSKSDLKVDHFFICTGNNSLRERYFDYIKKKGLKLVNVIHPLSVISKSVRIGEGVFIGANVVITHNVTIGNGVIINTAATIDHDNAIKDFVNISPGCHTSGRVKVEKGAFLGSGVIVKPDVTIQENTVVGAGAVVIKNVVQNTKVVGVPAREIK